MNKQVKKKWLSALESGKYDQGYRQLIIIQPQENVIVV